MSSPRFAFLILSFLFLLASGCDRRTEVVLYTSADDYVVRAVVEAFEEETGTRVRVVGDTEATKTTGLVQRLLAEQDRPRADVWWSSEAFGTIQLSKAGVLDPFSAELLPGVPWPDSLRAADGTWHGFAQRSRVLVYSADRVDDPPTSLLDLTGERWKGRVGIARPEFGTTRGHMAALVELWGAERFESWLTALEENGLRVYDGNATVVRAVAHGEIDVALTDTDDVHAGQANGWAVGMVFGAGGEAGIPYVMPNTAGLVRSAPNPGRAEELLRFILSAQTERVIAESTSRNQPIREGLALELGMEPWRGIGVSQESVAGRVDEAMAICRRVLR